MSDEKNYQLRIVIEIDQYGELSTNITTSLEENGKLIVLGALEHAKEVVHKGYRKEVV